MNIGKTALNITYHPIIENYEEFENVIEDDGQGKESNISFYFPEGNYEIVYIEFKFE